MFSTQVGKQGEKTVGSNDGILVVGDIVGFLEGATEVGAKDGLGDGAFDGAFEGGEVGAALGTGVKSNTAIPLPVRTPEECVTPVQTALEQ
jgi:hypothetical protein